MLLSEVGKLFSLGFLLGNDIIHRSYFHLCSMLLCGHVLKTFFEDLNCLHIWKARSDISTGKKLVFYAVSHGLLHLELVDNRIN